MNKTQFNKKGVWVRSYVVAEHHNQLVMSVLKTQTFIGYNLNTKIDHPNLQFFTTSRNLIKNLGKNINDPGF